MQKTDTFILEEVTKYVIENEGWIYKRKTMLRFYYMIYPILVYNNNNISIFNLFSFFEVQIK